MFFCLCIYFHRYFIYSPDSEDLKQIPSVSKYIIEGTKVFNIRMKLSSTILPKDPTVVKVLSMSPELSLNNYNLEGSLLTKEIKASDPFFSIYFTPMMNVLLKRFFFFPFFFFCLCAFRILIGDKKLVLLEDVFHLLEVMEKEKSHEAVVGYVEDVMSTDLEFGLCS